MWIWCKALSFRGDAAVLQAGHFEGDHENERIWVFAVIEDQGITIAEGTSGMIAVGIEAGIWEGWTG